MTTESLNPITPNHDRHTLVTPPVDESVAVEARVQPAGIPDEAWLAMKSLQGRSKAPVEPSQFDQFLAHQRRRYEG